MSTTIDNRVVGLQFDNKQFEKNVSGTLQSLDKLEDSLKFKGAQKGFSDLEKASSKCDLSHIGKAAEVIQQRFSDMGIMGMTVLTRLANKAVTVGEQMLKSLTIAPVSQGYQEYELKMGSIQTIMASTGESLDTVNEYLADLNEYSDRTIYSFADMTNSIGQFTNAGVKLEDACEAIKGISNEAALSGANAQQASHAMYNFAQALSTGAVRLQDWKSINIARMDTIGFKNNLLETAKDLGTVRKEEDKFITATTNANGKVSEAFDATKMWNESLAYNWLTADVLITTLKKYTDETTKLGKDAYEASQSVKTFTQFMDTAKEAVGSGWATTWEIIFGDFETARQRYTEVSNFIGEIISKISKARNSLLSDIFESPWSKLTKKIDDAGIKVDTFNEDLIALAKEGGTDVQKMLDEGKNMEDLVQDGVITGGMINKILHKYSDSVGEAGDATEVTTDKIVNLKGVVDDVMRGNYGNGADRVKALTDAGYDYAVVQDLVDKTIAGEAVSYEQLSNEQLKSIGYTEEQITAIRELAEEADKSGSSVSELIANINRPGGGKLLFRSIMNTFKGIHSVISSIKTGWSDAFRIKPSGIYKVIEKFHSFSERLMLSEDKLKSITRFSSTFFATINKILTKITGGIHRVFSSVFRLFPNVKIDVSELMDGASAMLERFNSWIDGIGNASGKLNKFTDFTKQLTKQIPGIDKVSERISALGDTVQNALDVDLLKTYASKSKTVFQSLGDRFVDLWDAITSFDIEAWKNNSKKALNDFTKNVSDKFNAAKTAVGKAFSKIHEYLDLDFGSIVGITSLLGMGYGLIKLMKMVSNVGNAITEFGSLAKSIRSSFTVVNTSISKFFKSLTWVTKAKAFKIAAFGLIELAAAVAILAGSMWIISQIPENDLLSSAMAVVSLVGILSVITLATAKFAGKEGLFSLAAVVGSVFLLVVAIKMLDSAELNWAVDQLAYLAEMILAVVALLAITKLMNKSGGDMLKSAVTLMAISGSVILLTLALKAISTIDLQALVANCDSLLIVLGMLIGLSVIARLAGKNAAKAGLGMIALVGAIYLLVPMLFALAALPKQIVKKASKTLLMIMGVFGILIMATAFAGPNAHKAAAVILAMSLALIPIAGIVFLLGSLNPDTCKQGVAAISVILLAFSILVASASNVEHGLGVIIGLAAAVVTIGLVIAALSLMDPASVVSSAMALSLVMIALTAALSVLTNQKATWGSVGKMAVQLIAMLAALEVIALIITQLSNLQNPDIAIKMAIVMSALLLEIVAVLGVCTLIGMAGPAAINGILALDAVILNFGVLLGTFAGLEYLFPGTAAFLETGIPLLSAIGEGIGAFVGGVIGGISVGIMASLITTAELFGDFCETISEATAKLNVPEGMGTTLSEISKSFLTLTEGRFLNGISDLLGFGSFDNLGTQMSGLGDGIAALFESVKYLTKEDLDKVKIAADAGSIMAKMANDIPNSGGLLGRIVGNNDMDDFANQFEGFGSAIVALSKTGVDVDCDGLTNIKEAGKQIAEMADMIPNSGGLLGDIVGNNDMSTFAMQFDLFGSCLVSLSHYGILIDTDGIKTFVDTVTDIIDMGGKLSKTNTDALEKLITTASAATAAYNEKVVEAGENFAIGYANGIGKYAYIAKNNAYQMGIDSLAALNESTRINSPSKDAAKSGKFFDQGYANAISKYSVLAGRAAGKMGHDSLYELNSAIARMNTVIEHDATLHPVIKPVVDMTDVNGSLSGLSASYTRRQAIRINSSHEAIRTASYMHDEATLSALKNLHKDIQGMSNNSYTINGLNVGNDTEVSDAIETLVRATRIGRRK